MHRRKKAQVTIFIIIGLVMLIGAFLVLGFAGKLSFFNPEEIIAPDKTAVKNYVESCLRETVLDGITLVAFQGGYAKIEEGPWKINKRGDYQEFLGSSGFKIPYWENNGRSFAPSRQDVEKQLEMYVDARLNDCLDDLRALEGRYVFNITGDPKSNVILGAGKATVELDYPIVLQTVKRAGTTPVDEFYATVDTNMYDALSLAHLIKEDNDVNERLWNLTIELISGSALPFKGYEVYCDERLWDMEDLEDDFNNVAGANLRYMTFRNTQNEELVEEYPYYKYYENTYLFDIGAERKHRKLSVQVSPLRTSKFEIFPNKNGQVTSIDLQLPLLGNIIDTCLKIYNHFYTVDYAVKYTITDGFNLNFNFILPVNVLYNKPKTEPYQFDDNGLEEEDALFDMNYTTTVSDYCNDAPYDAQIYVEDSVSYQPVLNATVYYDCVVFRCKLGSTDYVRDDYGSPVSTDTVVKAKLPECYNGNLVVESKDHISDNIFITPSQVDGPITVKLKPVASIPLDFELVRISADRAQTYDFDYSNISVYMTVRNNDNEEFELTTYTTGVDDMNDLELRIPINSSRGNNITIELAAINLLTNKTVGVYNYNGVLQGFTLTRANGVTIPVLAGEFDPVSEDDMVSIYKDILPKSKDHPPRIR